MKFYSYVGRHNIRELREPKIVMTVMFHLGKSDILTWQPLSTIPCMSVDGGVVMVLGLLLEGVVVLALLLLNGEVYV